MKHPKRALLVLLAVPLLLFMSAEEGHGGPGVGDFAGKVVNFLILFGGLAYVLYRPVRELLGKRSADIRQALASAQTRREDVERKCAETGVRLEGLEGEIKRIKAGAEEEARLAGERIGSAAAAEAERIKRFAEQEIEEQVRGGFRALKSYAAEQAAALARERIRKRLTARDQALLIDKSIGRFKQLHEKPGPHQ